MNKFYCAETGKELILTRRDLREEMLFSNGNFDKFENVYPHQQSTINKYESQCKRPAQKFRSQRTR